MVVAIATNSKLHEAAKKLENYLFVWIHKPSYEVLYYNCVQIYRLLFPYFETFYKQNFLVLTATFHNNMPRLRTFFLFQ